MFKVDLHIHTNNSDGTLSIDDVLRLASKLNIQEISITDHDIIGHLKNYRHLEQIFNIRIIPGVEITADISKMHVLGYGIKDFDAVESFFEQLKVQNVKKNRQTIDILQGEGVDISFEKVMSVSASDLMTHRDIARYLVMSGYAKDSLEAYKKFIGKGNNAYVPSSKYTFEEVIRIIRESGGIAVLAHPYMLPRYVDLEDLIPRMKKSGLTGLEVYTKRHSKTQKDKLHKIAQKYDLLETAGSDFHNPTVDIMGIDVDNDFMQKIHKVITC